MLRPDQNTSLFNILHSMFDIAVRPYPPPSPKVRGRYRTGLALLMF